jgi:PAS domain S-box-containing protein
MPHGYCLQWNPNLLILLVLGNFLTAFSYFSIPLSLFVLVRNRRDLPFKWVYGLFSAFIVACGLTHLANILTIWRPVYWLSGWLELITGLISLYTAFVLWKVLPDALREPSADLKLFRRLFDIMPQLGWTALPDGNRDFFNKGWYDYTGTTFGEMKGWQWESVHEPSRLQLIREQWRHSFETGSAFQMEALLKKKDGTFRWFLTRVSPLFNEAGAVERWVGVNTDIHDYKELAASLEQRVAERTSELELANAKLRESEERLHLALESSGMGVWDVDLATGLTTRSLRHDQIFGFSELLPQWNLDNFYEHVVPEERASARDAIEQSIKTGKLHFECRITSNQQIRWIALWGKAYRGNSETISRLTGIILDISETKKAELAIREQAELIDQANSTILVLDTDGLIRMWNKGAVAMYGYTKDFAVGKISHQLLQTKFPKALEEIKNDLAKNFVWDGELEHRKSDGSKIIVTSRWALRQNDQGITQVVEVNSDITKLKQIESRLANLTTDLRRSNKDLQDFAYVASHDLQEPLRTVVSFCELLAKKNVGRLDADSSKYISIIVESTKRLQQLIRDLLVYARLDSQENRLTKVDMKDPVDSCLLALKQAIAQSHAEVSCDDMPSVLGDRTQLSLLFQNLVSNALKFRSKHKPRIHIGATKSGDFWEISVKDNGIGMKMEYAERVFVIFQRLHSKEEYEGTGIGLAICKRIVERHGGEISLTSAPGEGSTFTFKLREAGVNA